MKKFLLVFIICVLSIFTVGSYLFKAKSNNIQNDMASRIIRFHVVANSDSKSDQALKLKVRDEIL